LVLVLEGLLAVPLPPLGAVAPVLGVLPLCEPEAAGDAFTLVSVLAAVPPCGAADCVAVEPAPAFWFALVFWFVLALVFAFVLVFVGAKVWLIA
jgi:hypothetical protein